MKQIHGNGSQAACSMDVEKNMCDLCFTMSNSKTCGYFLYSHTYFPSILNVFIVSNVNTVTQHAQAVQRPAEELSTTWSPRMIWLLLLTQWILCYPQYYITINTYMYFAYNLYPAVWIDYYQAQTIAMETHWLQNSLWYSIHKLIQTGTFKYKFCIKELIYRHGNTLAPILTSS